jgi:hypothetical protein
MQRALYLIVGVMLFCWLFISCQENTVEPTEENSSELTLNKGGVVENVTGSGHFVINEALRVFTHNASLKANGSVNGHFMLNRHDSGIHFSGSVFCFQIIANTAYFAGVIENSNSTDVYWDPGSFVIWSTIDNGQGNNSPADQVSLVWSNLSWTQADVVALICGPDPASFGFGYFDVESGNIQIH